jgi:hypothetical protein
MTVHGLTPLKVRIEAQRLEGGLTRVEPKVDRRSAPRRQSRRSSGVQPLLDLRR